MYLIKKLVISKPEFSKKKYRKLEKCKDQDLPIFSFENQIKICKIVDVYDGDSFTACFFNNDKIIKYKFRAYGYDSPEIRPRLNLENRQEIINQALKAKEKFIEFSNCQNNLVKIEFGNFDKYGRILGTVFNIDNDNNVNELMIKNGFGYQYDGGTKKI